MPSVRATHLAHIRRGTDLAQHESIEEKAEALQRQLNERVSTRFEELWPTVNRTLGRMARARWDIAPLGTRPRSAWRITTTLRLLEPPKPTPIELALNLACACIHVELQSPVRGAIEGWTVSLRAYPERDELQVIGSTTQTSGDLSVGRLRSMLRVAQREGPRRYDLKMWPLGASPAMRRHLTLG